MRRNHPPPTIQLVSQSSVQCCFAREVQPTPPPTGLPRPDHHPQPQPPFFKTRGEQAASGETLICTSARQC